MLNKIINYLKKIKIFTTSYSLNVFDSPLSKEDEQMYIERHLKGDKDARNKLTQEEIATILEVNRATYTGWELGTNTVPLRKLFELNNYYKFSINYIMELSKTNNYVFISNKVNFKTIGSNLRYLRKKEELTQK